ncbi:PQQ-dependent sugar dehydrogenase [Gracilimonas mengyeensis]|uniref:Glucose/arabinose dehydrogenase, beta-propeller fold n=1 Tax=Gracilimonas mengyeensis TaxID=1302730 RepID=A0A521FCT0_9BACT|nr:PQQ-dependent sugar dehydrogenase [Gracilimonas mengyeensis]SMO93310.1 Glucose/arabinose dehydrogenase, beta-propeller fold [Gracilimonas mengyeensis]
MTFSKRTFKMWPLAALALIVAACSGEGKEATAQQSEPDTDISVEAERVVSGITIGWGMAFLPNGDLLVTEKSGSIYHISDGEIVAEITEGIPSDLDVNGQGGFLDIELHPNYEENGWIYFSYSSSAGEGDGSNTAIIRSKLEGNSLVDTERIYKATPNSTRGQHYGSRIVFDDEGYLYFSVGDRGNRDVNPQDITRDGGKVYRLNDDGSIPEDNPFVGEEGIDAVYSYGHRNPQGMAVHPETGVVWSHEHGPRGGDEVNIHEAGANYGWPEISYGINYDGTVFTEDTAKAGMKQPIHYWDPSIAPSGMAFITSDKYPGWEGDLLIGSLKFAYIAHLEIEGDEVVGEEKLVEGAGRLRAIEQGPDGYIYFSAEGDGIYRLVPSTE